MVGLKRVWSDGTSALVFSPAEPVERLVALVPPPRANQLIYRGVVAANAAWRAEVVPSPRTTAPTRPRRAARSASRDIRACGSRASARAGVPELERPVGARVPRGRPRVPRLRRPAHAPLRRAQPAGHPAHPRRAAPRDGTPWARPRGRRPEGVTTRDRGRRRVRGLEKAPLRAPATRVGFIFPRRASVAAPPRRR